MAKLNPILKWWVTEKLPYQDVFSGYEKKATNPIDYLRRLTSMWLIHPIKRRVARVYLKFLQMFTGIKVIGVTGSSGKTTTTEMLASILKLGGKTVWSKESVDPIYNIPNTILRASPSTKYLILEMSVEYPGEMDFYLWLAKPDIGVITNIFPTHTEFFGDTEGVFKEKSKLIKSLSEGGKAVLNVEDKFLSKLGEKIKVDVVWFGKGSLVVSSKEEIRDFRTEFLLTLNQDQKLKTKITLQIPGKHFITSALAASAVSKSLGFNLNQIKKGLENFKQPDHRMKVIKDKSGTFIFDDSYNNNPQSATETISTFLAISKGKDKVVVFGDMLELGEWEEKYHKEIGQLLGKSGLTKLICVGNASQITAKEASLYSKEFKVMWVPTYKEAISPLKLLLRKNTTVLVKGSRSIHLEYLVEGIK